MGRVRVARGRGEEPLFTNISSFTLSFGKPFVYKSLVRKLNMSITFFFFFFSVTEF